MATLRVRINEGSDEQPTLLWDSVWFPTEGYADWAIAGADEIDNIGGLQAKAALHTAVILSLFSDKRMPDNHPLRKYVGDDQRGWWGDGVDVQADQGETELGSLLWAFERAVLTDETRQWVEAVALDALAPLVTQKAVVRIDANATANYAANRCDLAIQLYGADGQLIYDQRFENIWQQTTTAPAPTQFLPFASPLPPSS